MKKKTRKKAKKKSIPNVTISGSVFPLDYREATAVFHRRLFMKVLRKEDGNMSKAAARLGISRRTLQLQSLKLDIDSEAIRNRLR